MTEHRSSPGENAPHGGARAGREPVRLGATGAVAAGRAEGRDRPAPGDGRRGTRRLVGVDAARGLALFGMVAVHTFPLWNEEAERTTLSWSLFGGNAAALFATLAGVSLAFSSGGRTPHTGRRMTASRVSIAVRAAVIALVGLLLGLLELPVDNILAYYGVIFLLALPFLGLRIRHLLLSCALFALLTPFLMQWALDALPPDVHGSPSLWSLAVHPESVLPQLLLTGTYPALPWMTFLLAGLALGRMHLSETVVQARLVIVGAALAVVAYAVSMTALLALGGYTRIADATPWMTETDIDEVITFGPDPELPTTTLWWLLVPGPHTNTPFALLLSLGTAVAALGTVLLLARGRAAARAMHPLAVMGSMTFTLYTLHLLFMWLEIHYDAPTLWLWVQILAFAVFALAWRRAVGQGPLEKAVATAAKAAGRRVLARGTGNGAGPGTS